MCPSRRGLLSKRPLSWLVPNQMAPTWFQVLRFVTERGWSSAVCESLFRVPVIGVFELEP